MTSTITEADIEEAKVPKYDFKTELKQLNKKILQSYRIQALESIENYWNQRGQKIDEIIAEVLRKGELLK